MADVALSLETVGEARQERPRAKWSPRRSLAFVVGASTGLWAMIITAVAAVIP